MSNLNEASLANDLHLKQKHKSVTVVPAQNWLQFLLEEVCGVTREKVDRRPVGIVQERCLLIPSQLVNC